MAISQGLRHKTELKDLEKIRVLSHYNVSNIDTNSLKRRHAEKTQIPYDNLGMRRLKRNVIMNSILARQEFLLDFYQF